MVFSTRRGSWASRLLLASLCLASATLAQAQAPDSAKIEYRIETVSQNLHVLFGAGGNIAVLTGPDGALVVDSDVLDMSPKLRGALAMVSDKPARILVNTHFHFDHTGGNPSLGRSGAVIVAHDNVRKRLVARQVINVGTEIVMEPTPPEGLPVITFENGLSLHVNGEDIAVNHVKHGHTDSDAFVFFARANVLHTGDLMMSIGYPFVDAGNGGTLSGLIAGQERMLALCNENTRVIPGHGSIVAKAELQAYHDMLLTIWQRIGGLVKKGRSLEQVQSANPTREFDERWGKGFVSPQLFVQRVFIELAAPRKKG